MFYVFTKKRQGVTLIELLVVIAIIGLLAGIVLIAFGGARDRAKDARITSDMNQLQNLAENLYLEDGNYDNVDPVLSPEIAVLEDDIIVQGGSSITIQKSTDQYCAYAFLNSFNNCVDPGPALEAFCVDSWGTAKKVGTPSDVHCLSNFLCVAYFDSNGDGAVENDELNAVYSGRFGCGSECSIPNPSCYDSKLDINNDGCINILDLSAGSWGSKLCTTT